MGRDEKKIREIIAPLEGAKYEGKEPLGPHIDDLVRLYLKIKKRFCVSVLEFGLGYSTFVIAQALKENKERWDALENKPEARRTDMFQLHSIECSGQWATEIVERLPESLYDVIRILHCRPYTALLNNQLCHLYDLLPDVVPDFIYLDGPDPAQVQGSIQGLSFQCPERTPMTADPLIMESTMLPGTMILIDGRTQNARFLARNFQRNWDVRELWEEDVTIFELCEPRLGSINSTGMDILWEIKHAPKETHRRRKT